MSGGGGLSSDCDEEVATNMGISYTTNIWRRLEGECAVVSRRSMAHCCKTYWCVAFFTADVEKTWRMFGSQPEIAKPKIGVRHTCGLPNFVAR